MQDKFLGGLIGCALGDAIGELAFRYRTEERLQQAIAQSTQLRYTDDTAMAIGLASSLTERGTIDAQHLGDTFRKNYGREPWRGYASGPPTIFRQVESGGVTYAEAAKELFGGEGSFGNGAAMRVVPVGLFYHGSPSLYAKVRSSAEVTHAHALGIDGAAIIARAVSLATEPGPPLEWEPFLDDLIALAQTSEMRARLKSAGEAIRARTPPQEVGMRLGPGVAAHQSVPFAIYAFLSHPQSFTACLFCAALNSGDRDTVAAMACSISGAYLGIDALPREWQEKLENREILAGLAKRLWEKAQ